MSEYTPAERRQRIFAIVAASSGNLVEWFDFYVYAFSAMYFAPAFFPKADETAQLLNTAGVFAAGFLMRPIGGWLFGRLADRYGRKRSMLVSVAIMCAGSLAIACLPTYAQIGGAAPALLLVARLVQGLSVGGEYGATATYMSEVAMRGRRGFYSSFQYVTLIGGQLLAVLLIVLLEHVLTEAQLKAWGWRIPFAAGALTAVVALALRRALHETQSDEARGHEHAGNVLGLLRVHGRAFTSVFLYSAGGSLYFYTFTTYMQKHLVTSVGLPMRTASIVMGAALFVFMCVQPLFGMLSDRIGRRSSMLAFSILGMCVVLPVFVGLGRTDDPYRAFALVALALVVLGVYTSIAGVVKAEMFPPEVRALGVGLAYALGNALFGGSAEYVALALKARGHEEVYPYYVTAAMVIVLLVSWRLPRTARFLHHDR